MTEVPGTDGETAIPSQASVGGATIGVIICAYTEKRWPELTAGVEAAVSQLGRRDGLTLVIDHNEDLRRRAAAAFDSMGVTVVASSEDPGLSGARNTGIDHCPYDVAVFLDDDAVPLPGWVSGFKACFDHRPRVVCVGGAVEPNWEGGRAPRWFPPEFAWVVGCDYRGMPPSGSPIRNPIGANMAIRHEAFARAGRFRAQVGRVGELPVGCEETELAIRIKRAMPGTLIIRDTAPTVSHLVPRARQELRYFVRRCYHEGRSKAAVARLVGSEQGLSAERAYATKTLASGMLLHLGAAATGDPWGLARAGALPLGLITTTVGFMVEQARWRLTRSRSGGGVAARNRRLARR